jgi:hypothetical protein
LTERSRYTFTVKEFGDGTPWIAAEPLQENIAGLGKKLLGFDLNQGTTLEQAQEIARYMKDHIAWVNLT